MSLSELGPRDPEGYYVVKVEKSLLSRLGISLSDFNVVDMGSYVLLRTRSRRKALKILKIVKRSISG